MPGEYRRAGAREGICLRKNTRFPINSNTRKFFLRRFNIFRFPPALSRDRAAAPGRFPRRFRQEALPLPGRPARPPAGAGVRETRPSPPRRALAAGRDGEKKKGISL